MLGKLELSFKQSSLSREQIKLRLNQQIPELVRHLNWVIEQAETRSGKQVLIVIEGLDKVDLKAAADIFRDHAPSIILPQAHMIYTFPLALRLSSDFFTVKNAFSIALPLPNISIHYYGTPDEGGLAVLRQLVLNRAESNLIEGEALDFLVKMSGGLPKMLVELMRSAALDALVRKAERIELADAKKAAKDSRRDLYAPLTRADRETLAARHRDYSFSNDADEQRLIYNGSLVEYENDHSWCDAHPLLWEILEQEARAGARPS